MILRDQIHGEIELTDDEMVLVNSRPFDRMRYIKQLGFVEVVFPGASHNRFQHSLGVCQCVTDMYNAVVKNCPDFYREGDLELLRMIALCHDIGHSPFSHASEVLSNITHEERLTTILQHERKKIILKHKYNIEAWDLVNQVYNGEGFTYLLDSHLISLHDFMDNFIDADKLDYLERDSINCGVAYGNFDREALISSLTMIKNERGIYKLAIKHEGVQALEGFILARYYMFSQIYMHPIERLLRMQFCVEMNYLLPDGKYPDDTKKFLSYDDTKFCRNLKFLYNNEYSLVYDSEYDERIKKKIDSVFGERLVCDTPRKSVFRKGYDDATIYVVNSLTNQVVSCDKASPIIKGIEFASVHKLRYYAPTQSAESISDEIVRIVRGLH